MLYGVKGKLLKKQAGKCRWCGLLFHDEDRIEIDHITPKSHRHCHDERHLQQVAGTYDKGQIIEEPDASKWRTSGSEDEQER
jgi:RNA-directed DNA polymerase